MTIYLKHPRTYHFPWSHVSDNTDKILQSVSQFENKDIIITEKRDGENTSLYRNGLVHARSLDGTHHPWQDVIKSLWAKVCFDLPEGWRVVGENLRAEHSIRYENLSDWLEVFAIFDENNNVLSWDDILEWCDCLGLNAVPELWRGPWNLKQIMKIGETLNPKTQEGYVVRLASLFHYNDWSKFVGKWVRQNHVQTDIHWRRGWQPNCLKS